MQLQPRLVTAIPERPQAGVLYVSVEYATTLHLCPCGCGHEIVLGISPNDWKVYWDGPTVTISPSVGNWSLPCQSHYIIRRNTIQWAGSWSDKQIAHGRAVDAIRKRPGGSSAVSSAVLETPASAPSTSGWRRLMRKLGL